jgi:NADH dehydrogenase
MVQISAIGADPNSQSDYARTKALGEQAVREAMPGAAILRPSIVFGAEDKFFNRFGAMAMYSPIMPVICGNTRFQPVYVGDVADAVIAGLERDDAAGVTYELGGPRVYTFRELLAWILHETRRHRALVDVPLGVANLQARLAERLPGKPFTRDQLLLLQRDNVVAEGMPGLASLDILPTPIELVVPEYLDRYRPGGGKREEAPAM